MLHPLQRTFPLTAFGKWQAAIAAMVLMASGAASAAESATATITDPVAMWALPTEVKRQVHPLRMEGRVSYYDPSWRLFWLEQDGPAGYMALATDVPEIHTGQRVLIEGTIVPDEGLSARRVTVKVLEDHAPVVAVDAAGRIGKVETLNSRTVTTTAYVDSQLFTDADHVRLALIVDDRPVIGWFKPDDPKRVPNWEGTFIRVEGLYSARFDPTNTEATIELWIGSQRNITLLGTRDDFPGFALPVTPISGIHQIEPGTTVLVRGSVVGHEADALMLIRDASGQMEVYSPQHQRVPLGTEVEASGRVALNGRKWVLRSAMYRTVGSSKVAASTAAANVLSRVAQIRELTLEEAGRGQSVQLEGLVSWSLPDHDFFFLQDVSGGIRIHFDPAKWTAPPLGKYLRVDGATVKGVYVPGIELNNLKDLGAMSPPAARPVTFEQAITGKEDGQWVEMRGFLQRTESDGDWRRIFVTTPSGEFVGLLKSPVNLTANPGSLITVRGVCEAVGGADGGIAGVTLRVPFLHSITTEDDAPIDYYDLPMRSVKGLRQLSGARGMTRVRIVGTVLYAVPGRLLYVEDKESSVLVFTRQADAPPPGTRVEVVGILGWEGARIALRESVYLQVSSGPRPVPLSLAEPAKLAPALDGRLVTIRGVLIDRSRGRDYDRLTLQSGKTLFEAVLAIPAESLPADLAPGATLELTGIYRLVFEDTRELRTFTVEPRSAADVRVISPPKLWTLHRALLACGALGGLTLLGLAWIAALRRRVRQQTEQIREQLERQARLEPELQRAARLESLGQLAGGIAHDFNNLLTVIIGNAGLALMDGKVSATAANCLREIERGAERARSLTQQLLTFAKGGEPLRAAIDVAQVVRQSTELALHDSNVRCDFTIERDLRPAYADKDQLARAIHNLVRNAIQAMPHGGLLMVSVKNEHLGADSKVNLPAGDYLKLTFSDTGEGIKPDVLPRIFDPYFSTRKSGSGLGLATVYSIVKRHQGRIEAESNAGAGATFHVWLPAAAEDAPTPTDSPAKADRTERVSLKTPRVLLMDDEASIREIATAVLAKIGTEPVAVADGGAALREFSLGQHQGRPFELVILDLTIPGGMGGREAMELIRKLDPDVPVIVSSGYSSDPVMANYAAFGFQAVVPKPYEVKELAAVANRLLGRTT